MVESWVDANPAHPMAETVREWIALKQKDLAESEAILKNRADRDKLDVRLDKEARAQKLDPKLTEILRKAIRDAKGIQPDD